MKLTIRQLRYEEIYKDIVRIPEMYRLDQNGAKIEEGTVCCIKVGARSKLVAARGCEGEERRILMDAKTRDQLGVVDKQDYEVELVKTSWWGHSLWAWSASDPAYRIPARLGVSSVALGILGLLLGVLSVVQAIRS